MSKPYSIELLLNWRSLMNRTILMTEHGELYFINPITYKNDTLWSDKKHDGILFPNQRIALKGSSIR